MAVPAGIAALQEGLALVDVEVLGMTINPQVRLLVNVLSWERLCATGIRSLRWLEAAPTGLRITDLEILELVTRELRRRFDAGED